MPCCWGSKSLAVKEPSGTGISGHPQPLPSHTPTQVPATGSLNEKQETLVRHAADVGDVGAQSFHIPLRPASDQQGDGAASTGPDRQASCVSSSIVSLAVTGSGLDKVNSTDGVGPGTGTSSTNYSVHRPFVAQLNLAACAAEQSSAISQVDCPPSALASGFESPRMAAVTGAMSDDGRPDSGLSIQRSVPSSEMLPSLAMSMPPGPRTLQQLTVASLNEDIQELTFIGSGGSGDVYSGIWQGAVVAIKYIITAGSSAADAAVNEAVLGQLVAHPNVVQTFSSKYALLDENFFRQLNDLVSTNRPEHQQGEAHHPEYPAEAPPDGSSPAPAEEGSSNRGPQPRTSDGGATHVHTTVPPHASFVSGEGFGNPLSRQGHALTMQEVLFRTNAKPGHVLTQIVMEHCDKGSLLQAIKRSIFRPTSKWGAKLALRALLRTAREIAQGLWHIHQSNVLHGDLKPGNVLLRGSRADRRGFVAKVSDFGLARICDRTVVDNGSNWGTVQYMAPEALAGTITKASDVFSFGVTLWQMVTGERPFADLHPGQVAVGVQAGSLKLEWPPETHPRVLKLALACLDPDHKRRPAFNYIMRELSLIESAVRLEGARDGGLPVGPPLPPHVDVSNGSARYSAPVPGSATAARSTTIGATSLSQLPDCVLPPAPLSQQDPSEAALLVAAVAAVQDATPPGSLTCSEQHTGPLMSSGLPTIGHNIELAAAAGVQVSERGSSRSSLGAAVTAAVAAAAAAATFELPMPQAAPSAVQQQDHHQQQQGQQQEQPKPRPEQYEPGQGQGPVQAAAADPAAAGPGAGSAAAHSGAAATGGSSS